MYFLIFNHSSFLYLHSNFIICRVIQFFVWFLGVEPIEESNQTIGEEGRIPPNTEWWLVWLVRYEALANFWPSRYTCLRISVRYFNMSSNGHSRYGATANMKKVQPSRERQRNLQSSVKSAASNESSSSNGESDDGRKGFPNYRQQTSQRKKGKSFFFSLY